MQKQNSLWHPMTLREIVGLFVLLVKKPPDGKEKANERIQSKF